MIDITLLGCGGSMPTPDRYLTSLLITYNGSKILVDCGEGTQVSMKILGCGFKSIDVLCITHFHADHTAGIPGLLLTIANSQKTTPLTIIGPTGINDIINGLRVLCPDLPYDINIIESDGCSNNLLNINNISISSLSVDHRTNCNAYSFYLRRSPKFDKDKAIFNKVPQKLWSVLQKQDKVEYEGIVYNSNMVLGQPRSGIKITYCTDSRPLDEIIDFAKDSNLFICEGMYGDDLYIPKMIDKKHMVFSEAATMARKANVDELWLTHFSPAMNNPEDFIENTKTIFENTVIGKDRLTKTFIFDK
ncbi:MAG TPA: ribonuclease Z [Peptostreptococcaceae bacterium]|nr:ribonuclease Z [Peptostreptococcaceae bacterium]